MAPKQLKRSAGKRPIAEKLIGERVRGIDHIGTSCGLDVTYNDVDAPLEALLIVVEFMNV
jgi:hypothetical protein